jgi:hypothetical protein
MERYLKMKVIIAAEYTYKSGKNALLFALSQQKKIERYLKIKVIFAAKYSYKSGKNALLFDLGQHLKN